MEILLIILFWVFALIGMGYTLVFAVSLFRGRGNSNGGNKTATNKTSNNGGTANTTPPPYNGGSKN